MELTKEQIKYIDNQIEKYGVEYWDVRVELVDHTVSYVENNLKRKEDFKKIVHKAFVRLGWKGTFSHLNTQGWKSTNKLYRRIYFNGFVDFFKSVKNLTILIICFLIYFYISEAIDLKTFTKFSYVLFLIPTVVFFYESYVTRKKKYGKSVHKQYGLHYLISTTFIFQIIPMSLKDNGLFSIPVEYHKLVLFTLIPVHLIFAFSGYNVYKTAMKRVEKMKKQLL